MTPEFRARRFQRSDSTTEPMADRNVQVRLTQSIDAAVRRLPNRSAWLRRVITDAVQRELMVGEDTWTVSEQPNKV